MADPTTHRVAQWATGNIGTQSLRAVIDHPRHELVGLHRAVNAVGVVCAAAPGIRTTVDLPQVIAHLGT